MMTASVDSVSRAAWTRDDFWWAVALVTAGLGLRLLGIHELGLHSDEAIFISIGGNDSAIEAWRNSLVGPHPPANYLMLHWMTAISWSPLWLKSGSLVGGALAVGLAYAVGRELFDRWAGLAMGGLVAFSPALIEVFQKRWRAKRTRGRWTSRSR